MSIFDDDDDDKVSFLPAALIDKGIFTDLSASQFSYFIFQRLSFLLFLLMCIYLSQIHFYRTNVCV